ncbi:MAG: hypothetical protein IPM25_18660 [Chloracidobacterium sp.]|nr:hypothetical protein [Chloracidobacterium sp.]
MRFFSLLLFSILLVGFPFAASAQKPSTPVPSTKAAADFLGAVAEGKYTNDFFEFNLEFPAEWTVVDQETSGATVKIGTDFLKGKDERSNRALEASTKSEVVLFHLARKPIGSIGNCSFMIAVLKQPSAHVLPTMVAEATKSMFVNSPNLKIVKDTRTGTVGRQKVAMVDYELSAGEQKVSILYYVAIVKGYSFSFSLTFSNEEDRKALEQIRDSMVFALK